MEAVTLTSDDVTHTPPPHAAGDVIASGASHSDSDCWLLLLVIYFGILISQILLKLVKNFLHFCATNKKKNRDKYI